MLLGVVAQKFETGQTLSCVQINGRNNFQQCCSCLRGGLVGFEWVLTSVSFFFPAGILGGIHWGLGVGSGVVVSGVVINAVGVPKTYFIFSLVSLAILAVFLIANWVTKFKKDPDETGYKLIETKEQDDQ